MRIAAIAATALALSACATTSTERDIAGEAGIPTGGEEQTVRCEPVSGSRLPGRRECRTEEEWANGRATDEAVMRETQGPPRNTPY